MSSKKTENQKHTKRNIIILVSFLVIVLVAIISFILLKPSKEESAPEEPKVTIKELTLELGENIPVARDFSDDLTDDYEVIIEELESETLDKLGTFNVTLKNGGEEYRTKLIVQDTLAPSLTLKESVNITEGDTVSIEDFIESCTDNSGTCTYSYVDESGNKLESIDLSIGEHTVNITAKDESENETTESTKLIVNKKPEEKPATNNTSSNKNNTTTNNNSNNSNTTTNSSSTNNSNNSNNNQNNTSGNNTNNGSSTTCEPNNNVPVYLKANCIQPNSSEDKTNRTTMSSSELSNKILYGSNYDSPARAELKKCDTYFRNINGDTNSYCADFTTAPIVVYSTDGRIYGYAVKFTMKYADAGSTSYNKIAAEGYVNSNDTISYTTKNIPY